ncbi:MAG: hypothetical protein WBP81_31630 [Solirubrobacteraceae bacterium]
MVLAVPPMAIPPRTPRVDIRPRDVAGDSDLQARIESELPLLLALAQRLTREEHDDQDALERAWRAHHQLPDPARQAGGCGASSLAPSSMPTADKLISGPATPKARHADTRPRGSDGGGRSRRELTLRAALRKLTPADRIGLVLDAADGRPATELGELLDVRTDGVHKRIERRWTRLIAALAGPEAPTLTPSASACCDARARPARPHARRDHPVRRRP